MSQNQGDFTPAVKGGYKSDDAYHRRNWRALVEFLRSPFVTTGRIADLAVTTAKIEDAAITNAKIGTAAITNAQIESLSVDKLTGGELAADVVVGGELRTPVDGVTGRWLEIDSSGLRAKDSSKTYVDISSSGDARFTGSIVASDFSSAGGSFGGIHQMDANSETTLAEGVSAPGTQAATLAWTYPSETWDSSLSGTGQLKGCPFYDSTSSRFILPTERGIAFVNATTGAIDDVWLTGTAVTAVCRVGNNVYAVNKTGSPAGPWLRKVAVSGVTGLITNADNTWDLSHEIGAGEVQDRYNSSFLSLTSDGTDIYLSESTPTPSVRVSRWSTSLVWEADDSTSFYATGFRGVVYANTSSALWWVPSASTIKSYSNFSTEVTANAFPPALANPSGLMWDGTVFWTSMASTAYKHTTYVPGNTYTHVAFSWYDNTNAYETPVGTDAYVTNKKRSTLQITVPGSLPPQADRVRIYALESSATTAPTAGTYKRQVTQAALSYDMTSYASGGSAGPTSNTFPATSPSVLQTANTNPLEIHGDGSFILPRFATADAPSTTEGAIYYDTTDDVVKYRDGSAYRRIGGSWIEIIKASDETRGGTTLTVDNALSFSAVASGYYVIEFEVFFTHVSADDFDWEFQFSSALSDAEASHGWYTAITGASTPVSETVTAIGPTTQWPDVEVTLNGGGVGDIRGLFGKFYVANTTANPSTVALYWANNTSSDSNTVKAGSMLRYRRAG